MKPNPLAAAVRRVADWDLGNAGAQPVNSQPAEVEILIAGKLKDVVDDVERIRTEARRRTAGLWIPT
jgi:hypothetical protein